MFSAFRCDCQRQIEQTITAYTRGFNSLSLAFAHDLIGGDVLDRQPAGSPGLRVEGIDCNIRLTNVAQQVFKKRGFW